MANQTIPPASFKVLTGTGDVKTGSGVLDAIYVNAAIAGGAVTVADQLATIIVLPVGLAAGSKIPKVGVLNCAFATKLRATFGGSGSLTFIFR
jgi:hypothetical protein